MAGNDKINILVVDDLPERLMVYRAVLDELGENIITAGSGSEALKQVLRHEFAVILLDVNMPEMDGFETAALIRRRKKSALTPIIFVSAYPDELYTARGYATGAVDFIPSPVPPEILRTKVKVFVDLFRMREQIVRQADERIALVEERARRQAAEAASEAKSRFLANISHELRTPMNAILGMVDLTLQRTTEPAARDFLETAKESADLLLALLNDLLDCAKIESGKLELEAAPFSLRRVLEQTTRVLAVRARLKGVAFSCDIPDEVPDAVTGDPLRLQQILLNLVGNGIKFTEKGEVALSARVESRSAEEACLEFAVRDTGIGIPESELDRIFQPFTQADASTTRRFGGTGLGLTISSSLIGMMGGRIRVESRPERGSTFYFTVRLPLAEELPAEPEAAPEISDRAMSSLRILLVEDNPANQKFGAYILKDRGHTVDIAENGRHALSMTQRNPYDVILMDVEMPGMDGLETTANIRAARENGEKRVPIIAMTAHAMRGDRERCLKAGMDGYLSKPIDGREMIALIERLAAGSAPGDSPRAASLEPANPVDNAVFDIQLAIKRCYNNRDMLREMVHHFFDDTDSLFPKMHSAMQDGDLVELGRLVHRLKGAVVYLGATQATEAALRVERFLRSESQTNELAVAVNALERECEILKEVMAVHRSAGYSQQERKSFATPSLDLKRKQR